MKQRSRMPLRRLVLMRVVERRAVTGRVAAVNLKTSTHPASGAFEMDSNCG
jgi:hypothetical protein